MKCPNCNRSFKIDKLKVHLLYFCGETAQRTVAQARQYRSTDRHEGTSNKRKGGTRSKEKTRKSFSKSSTKVTTKQHSKSLKRTKKVTRATRTKIYESDSDLSLPDDFNVSSKRPSRSAACAAAQRLSASSKEWGGDNASDSDEFSDMGSAISSDDETSDEISAPPRTTVVKKGYRAKNHIDNVSSSDYCSSEDDAALVRAKKRQKLAFSRAHPGKKKKFPGEEKKKFPGKKTMNKRQLNESSSDEEIVDTADPLKGIDLEALKQKAMEGCQVSILHTMSWWRIVLDEAHVIK